MPTQLYNNSNISFICGRNFTWEGVDYKMGDDWDQDLAPGALDKLVRSRYIYGVVDSTDEKPRHWHHHVHVRSVLEKKLGITRELGQSSIATREPQGLAEQPVQDYKTLTPWEETQDNGETLKQKAIAAFLTEEVLKDEETSDEEQSEPEELILDEEHATKEVDEKAADLQEEDEEHQRQVDDLYDPADHGVNEVLAYLTSDISEVEYERVLASERTGKKRKGILDA